MSEFTYFDEEVYAQVNLIVRAKLERYVREVIGDIKKFPREARTSGDDSGLESFWEEFKYQVQREESHCFDLYVETIERQCQFVVEALPRDEQGLLWLWTDGYWKCDFEGDYEKKIPYGDPVTEALVAELFSRVEQTALDEELKFDPDEARALDRFEEDERLASLSEENGDDGETGESEQ